MILLEFIWCILTLIKPIISSAYNMNTALASHGFSLWRSILCKTYLTKVLMMIVSKMAYSKPNTSCTDAPVILHYKWYISFNWIKKVSPLCRNYQHIFHISYLLLALNGRHVIWTSNQQKLAGMLEIKPWHGTGEILMVNVP